MAKGVSGPTPTARSSSASPKSRSGEAVDLPTKRPGSERAQKSSDSAAKTVRHQPVNQGLQKIVQRQAGPLGEAAVAPQGDGAVPGGYDIIDNPLGNEALEAPEGGQQQDPLDAANEAAGAQAGEHVVDLEGGGEAPQGVRRQAAMDRLQDSGLADDAQKAGETIDAEAKGMYRAAGRTARAQGVGAYTKSFGFWGLASRAASVGTAAATKSPVVRGVVDTATPLTMTLFHGAAGADSKPGDEGTKFVKTADAQRLPPNAAGNAFRPFMGGLPVGNALVSGIVDGGSAIATEAGADAPPPAGSSAVQGTIKNALFFIPGMMSGIHTARNVFATQANAGMSLQEPVRNMAGDQIGIVVTHQEPIEREGGRQEIGQVKIDAGGQRVGVTILRDGENFAFERLGGNDVVAPETRTLGQRVGDYFRHADPRNSASATKIGALASTLAVSSTVSHFLGPAVKSTMEARGYDSATADSASKLATAATSSALLGLDFIPKFMTFDRATTPADAPPPEQRTPQQQREVASAERTNTFFKVGRALIPGIGGGLALASGQASVSAAPRLNEGQFTRLGEAKAEMLGALAQETENGVSRADDDTLRLEAGVIRNFIGGLPDPANAPAAGGAGGPAPAP